MVQSVFSNINLKTDINNSTTRIFTKPFTFTKIQESNLTQDLKALSSVIEPILQSTKKTTPTTTTATTTTTTATTTTTTTTSSTTTTTTTTQTTTTTASTTSVPSTTKISPLEFNDDILHLTTQSMLKIKQSTTTTVSADSTEDVALSDQTMDELVDPIIK